MKLLAIFILSISAYAQTTIPACGGLTISNALLVDVTKWRITQYTGSTTLAAPLAISDTTATVINGAILNAGGGQFGVDSEAITYASVSGNTVSGLNRGASGTTAASHIGPTLGSPGPPIVPATLGATVNALTYPTIPALCRKGLIDMFRDIAQSLGATSTVLGTAIASAQAAETAKQTAIAAAAQ